MKARNRLLAVATLRRVGLRSIAVPVSLITVMLAGATGCSASVETASPVSRSQLFGFKEGDGIVLRTHSGRTISGTFQYTARIPETEYSARYDNFRRLNPVRLAFPSIGDSVILLSQKRAAQPKGRLAGFEPEAIVIEWNSETPLMPVSLSTFEAVGTVDGRDIPRDTLRVLMEGGKVPFMSAIWVETEQGVQRYPTHLIRSIESDTDRPINSDTDRTLMYVGIGISVVAVAAIVTALVIYEELGKAWR